MNCRHDTVVYSFACYANGHEFESWAKLPILHFLESINWWRFFYGGEKCEALDIVLEEHGIWHPGGSIFGTDTLWAGRRQSRTAQN